MIVFIKITSIPILNSHSNNHTKYFYHQHLFPHNFYPFYQILLSILISLQIYLNQNQQQPSNLYYFIISKLNLFIILTNFKTKISVFISQKHQNKLTKRLISA